jgi:toxin ParE1/3/4
MNQYRVSVAARADLEEIWVYVAQDNVEAADRLIQAIVSRFPLLASRPEMGRKREEISARLRSIPVGNFDIARVLHGARDFPPLFV